MKFNTRSILPIALWAMVALVASAAWGQTRLPVSTSPAAVELAAPTCVKMSQAGEWVSDPILHSPWLPLLSDPAVCWGAFAVAGLVLYLLSFVLFQARVRNGVSAVRAFGGTMILFMVLVSVAGYFTTGHLSYAASWCIDHTAVGVIGAPPARTNGEILAQFGVGINEIIDRGAIPLSAHARITPWYLWLGVGLAGAAAFALGFQG